MDRHTCSEAGPAPGGVATKAMLVATERWSRLHGACSPAAGGCRVLGPKLASAACGVCIANGGDGAGSWVAAAQGGLLYMATVAATTAPPVAASAGGEVDQAPSTVQSATAAGSAKLTAGFRAVAGAAARSVIGSVVGAWPLVLWGSGKAAGSGAAVDAAAASWATGSAAGVWLLALWCSGAAVSAAGVGGTGVAAAEAAPSAPPLTAMGCCTGVAAAPPIGVWDVVSKVDAAAGSTANGAPGLVTAAAGSSGASSTSACTTTGVGRSGSCCWSGRADTGVKG